jgi:hypothetical protein
MLWFALEVSKRRYPARAVLAVTAAGLLLAVDVVAGFLCIALMLPLIPLFLSVIIGNACLLGAALDYAAGLSIPLTPAMLPGARHEQSVDPRPLTARV